MQINHYVLISTEPTIRPLHKGSLQERPSLGAYNFRKEDFVSQKVIALVSLLVLLGSVGGSRILFFVNNLTEYYGYSGFMSLFLRAFPALHEQFALGIVVVTAVIALYPITYLMLRLIAR